MIPGARSAAQAASSSPRPAHSSANGVRSTRPAAGQCGRLYGGSSTSSRSSWTASREAASTIICFHSRVTAISVEARKRVPMTTPWAPSASAAARPRPSAIPPAATTGMSPATSTTWGTRLRRADEAAVPSGLAALRDDHVDLPADGQRGLVDVHHLLDPADPGLVRPGHEIAGVAQVEGDGGRPRGEGGREGVLVERADLVVDRERTVRPLAAGVATGPRRSGTGRTAVPRLPRPPAAQIGRREVDGVPGTERRADHRDLDAQQVAEAEYACRPACDRGAGRHIGRTPHSVSRRRPPRATRAATAYKAAARRVETPIFSVAVLQVPADRLGRDAAAVRPTVSRDAPRQANRRTSTSRSVSPSGQRVAQPAASVVPRRRPPPSPPADRAGRRDTSSASTAAASGRVSAGRCGRSCTQGRSRRRPRPGPAPRFRAAAPRLPRW